MLQVDLPMPEACDVCPFNYDFCWCKAFENDEDWEKYSDDWNDHVCDREDRPEYCPLKEQEEVEPHHKCTGETYSLITEEHVKFCPWCGKKIKRT